MYFFLKTYLAGNNPLAISGKANAPIDSTDVRLKRVYIIQKWLLITLLDKIKLQCLERISKIYIGKMKKLDDIKFYKYEAFNDPLC